MKHFQAQKIEVIAHQRTKEGNLQCGDCYFFTTTDDYFICVLADGLGSGEYAFDSAATVVNIVEQFHHEDVEVLMNRCNNALMLKRGAAVAIFKVFYRIQEFEYSCVGNIRFFLYSSSGKLTYPLPVTGYLSGKPQKFHTQRYSYETDSKFLVYSDGFRYQRLKSILSTLRPLEQIAEDIKRTNPNTTDDATFIIGNLQ
ncbi:PP2C family serine/threonine-protein phosphatase [Bacillus dakarensis]|uniref:PP2C family serine/threonine-protein phosphatase n=1 Tax=Robertmurraya dakarensis TaxID=1926278 RepID=UPI0009818D8B|nr:PP2C family serine/threonine-protein phosphatase [Bacillus dakarensis]